MPLRGSTYRSDLPQGRPKKRLGSALAFLLILIFVAIAVFVVLDLLKNPTKIDESNNKAVIGEVTTKKGAYRTVETTDYKMDIPEDWVHVNRPQRIFEEGKRYYPDKYQGVEGESNGRWIEVYKNAIPLIPTERVIEVTASGDRLSTGEISPLCSTFVQPPAGMATGHDIPAEWNNLEFLCRQTNSGNSIAAVQTSVKDGYLIEGEKTSNKYLLVFADNGLNQDNSIFIEIIKSFRAK